MRWVLAFLMICCGVQVQAGAWPRAQGQAFVALSADATRAQLYAEYGLKRDWTLGVEVSMPRDRRLPDVSQFVHRLIWKGARASLSGGVAVELRETTAALAFPSLKGTSEIAARAGLFWGYGFDTRFGGAWATVDAQLERIYTTDWLGMGPAYKVDAGLGIRPTERLMLTFQAQYWQRGLDKTLRIETGAGVKLGRTTLVLQPSVGVIGARKPLVKLGLWAEF